MENILLSIESYHVLKKIELLSPIDSSQVKKFPEVCINQLYEYGLIKYRTTSYDSSGNWPIPKHSECFVTEKGKGYLAHRQNEEQTLDSIKSMAASAEEEAKAAKIQAELAIKAAADAEETAKQARRDAIFSKVLSVLALLVAICDPFVSTYATSIVDKLSQMLLK